MVNDPANPSMIQLSWTPLGSPAGYQIMYGTSKDNLSSQLKTTVPSATISNLEVGKEYFFQVYATDSNGVVSGKGSDIISLSDTSHSAAGQQLTAG